MFLRERALNCTALLYFYLQDHSTEVLHYDQFMSQRVNWLINYLI